MIDSKLSFWLHILKRVDKAAEILYILILYSSGIWIHVLDKEMYRNRLAQVQRRATQALTLVIRTLSEALVGAGAISIVLMAKERREKREPENMEILDKRENTIMIKVLETGFTSLLNCDTSPSNPTLTRKTLWRS